MQLADQDKERTRTACLCRGNGPQAGEERVSFKLSTTIYFKKNFLQKGVGERCLRGLR